MDALTRLAHQAAKGDDSALAAFVEAGYDPVWRLCAAMVDNQSADDLAQEVFVRAVRGLVEFRHEASARTWLLAIARHVCLDELRALWRHRQRRGSLDQGREPHTEGPSEKVALADMLARLDPDRREAFVLTQVLGLPYAEAARVCECPVGTVRSRVARARADLLNLLRSAEEATIGSWGLRGTK